MAPRNEKADTGPVGGEESPVRSKGDGVGISRWNWNIRSGMAAMGNGCEGWEADEVARGAEGLGISTTSSVSSMGVP